MAHSFPIYFDDTPPKVDKVVAAIYPLDAFSGRAITAGVVVKLMDSNDNTVVLPFKPVKNHSGMHVFINLPVQTSYQFKVEARVANYFDPPLINFTPAANTDPDRVNKRLQKVFLYRRPALAATDTDAVVVAGMIEKGANKISGAAISAKYDIDLATPGMQFSTPFETLTDENGNFALPLRLPDEAFVSGTSVTFSFSKAGDTRTFAAVINKKTFFSFEEPIDLTSTNQPALIPFGA